MDLTTLDDMVLQYLNSSLAPSTMKTYGATQKPYLTYCSSVSVFPVPLREQVLCQFVSSLAKDGLKHTSIKTYLSGIRNLQIRAGLGDPFKRTQPLLELVLWGIKMEQTNKSPQPTRSRLPITPVILAGIRGVWEQDCTNKDHIMLWAACFTCFFVFLCSGEITVPSAKEYDTGAHLSYGDVTLDSVSEPSCVQVRIKASKTDPFRQGVSVFLGATSNKLCPVAAVAAYLAVCPTSPGPFFLIQSGQPLTLSLFVNRVKETLDGAGIDSWRYSGHSFRIGAASTAAVRGVEVSLIKTLGRWKSSAYLLYVRIPTKKLANLSKTLS